MNKRIRYGMSGLAALCILSVNVAVAEQDERGIYTDGERFVIESSESGLLQCRSLKVIQVVSDDEAICKLTDFWSDRSEDFWVYGDFSAVIDGQTVLMLTGPDGVKTYETVRGGSRRVQVLREVKQGFLDTVLAKMEAEKKREEVKKAEARAPLRVAEKKRWEEFSSEYSAWRGFKTEKAKPFPPKPTRGDFEKIEKYNQRVEEWKQVKQEMVADALNYYKVECGMEAGTLLFKEDSSIAMLSYDVDSERASSESFSREKFIIFEGKVFDLDDKRSFDLPVSRAKEFAEKYQLSGKRWEVLLFPVHQLCLTDNPRTLKAEDLFVEGDLQGWVVRMRSSKRKNCFLRQYAEYCVATESLTLDSVRRRTLWREICEQWGVVSDDLPAQLVWNEAKDTVDIRPPEGGSNKWVADLGGTQMMDFVRIEEGAFLMGSTNGGSGGNPVHRVTLSKPFLMSTTEVTQKQYKQIMGSNPSHFTGDSNPVECVSWNEAMTFCKKLTAHEWRAGRLPAGHEYTLPTEAQWEYACRAGTTGDYVGDMDAMAWYNSNSGEKTHPVGTKQANAWGLYDMYGNVWEWCSDWYGDYPSGSVTDSVGADSSSYRVNRGGSWIYDAGYCRSAYRNRYGPSGTDNDLGFRAALVRK